MAASDVRLSRSPAPSGVAERVRTLRKHAGLTQTELAGERFSKEYVSQIELGKTKPSAEAIEYLAKQLDVDPLFLETGVSSDERSRIEATLSRGEALIEVKRYAEAVEEYVNACALVTDDAVPELEVRALTGEAWARMRIGEVKLALELLARARDLAERPRFSDIDRADVLYRMGVCRYELSSLQTAISLFTEALHLATKSDLPCDRLKADIYGWRSRCYRRQRDWEAAREDVELALELAEGMGDSRSLADTYFQASIVAERNGHWVLARTYAERAKAAYEELSDRGNLGRLLNNLGGINFLLGHPDEAISILKDSVRIQLEVGDDAEAAHAVNGIAQVHLRTGDVSRAEEQARYALTLLEDRVDHLDEIGNAQLVLGRSLLEQDRLDEAEEAFRLGEAAYDKLSSASHRATAWVAQGDLAARRGDDRTAARLYRQAADALQDVRF
jgi:tetratricopeptide (TPR) repeat protein